MADLWFISDLHLGHKNILGFKRQDGTPLRSFENTWQMEATIFQRWSETVKVQDKVYVLGDVAFTRDSLLRMSSLPGHKRLVRGNHDGFQMKAYLSVFEEIYGVRQIDGYWLTHVPMHPQSMTGRAKINIHGHLHANHVKLPDSRPDPRYFNVSVEQIDYRPINFEEIKKHWAEKVKV